LDEDFQFLGETLLDEHHFPEQAFVNETGLHIVYRENLDSIGKTVTWHIFEPKQIN